MNRQTVAVLGAGIAGLGAASELAAAGLKPVVFDKGRGPGGRFSTRRAAPFAFDHGAQYFTARDQQFVERVRAWIELGVVAKWSGRIVALREGIARELDEPLERFVGAPSMSALASHLAAPLDVRCGVRVAIAHFANGLWRLHGDGGELLGEFEQLIATLPHPQAAELLGSESELGQRARQSIVHPCWAVLLGARERLELDFEGAFCGDSSLSWIARNNSKPGRPPAEAWVLHATPAWTRAHLQASREQVVDALLDELARVTGVRMPPLEHRDAHLWRYASPEPVAPDVERAWFEPERSLALAGDACVGGRVEGAFLSGLTAARALLR